jgi:hypothetical protein
MESASGTIVKGSITGSAVAAGGGTTDLLAALGLEIAPDTFGLGLVLTGGIIVIGSSSYGMYKASLC